MQPGHTLRGQPAVTATERGTLGLPRVYVTKESSSGGKGGLEKQQQMRGRMQNREGTAGDPYTQSPSSKHDSRRCIRSVSINK